MCLSWQRHMYTLKEMGTGRAWFLEPYFFFLKPEVFWNLKGWVWWTWPMAWVTLFCYRCKFVWNIKSCFSVTHLLHTISISPWFVWITAKPSRDLQVEHVCCYFWSFCQSARLSPRKRLFTWKLESRWTVTRKSLGTSILVPSLTNPLREESFFTEAKIQSWLGFGFMALAACVEFLGEKLKDTFLLVMGPL